MVLIRIDQVKADGRLREKPVLDVVLAWSYLPSSYG